MSEYGRSTADLWLEQYARRNLFFAEVFGNLYGPQSMASDKDPPVRSGGSADGRAYNAKQAVVNGKPVKDLILIVEGQRVIYCRYSEADGTCTEPRPEQINWYTVTPAETCPSDGSAIHPLRVTLSFHSDNQMAMLANPDQINYVMRKASLDSLKGWPPVNPAALGWAPIPFTGAVTVPDPEQPILSPTLANLLSRVTVPKLPLSALIMPVDADPGPPPAPTPPPPAEDAIMCRGLEFETDEESD
jgi:hypothetical protein